MDDDKETVFRPAKETEKKESSEVEVLTCEVCGRPEGVTFGERVLCPECAQSKGSCCPEFGADDLWED